MISHEDGSLYGRVYQTSAFVPLGEMSSHTDDVRFGDMSVFPGVPADELLVNLTAIDRVRRLGGLGTLDIVVKNKPSHQGGEWDMYGVSANGDVPDEEYDEPLLPLTKTKVSFPEGSSFYGAASARIKLQPDALMQAVRTSEVQPGAPAWADALNLAVKAGLHQAVAAANVDKRKLETSLAFYSPLVLLYGTAPASMLWWPALLLGLGPFAGAASAVGAAVHQHAHIGEYLRDYRKTLFFGCAYDRVLAGSAAVALSTFVKAR